MELISKQQAIDAVEFGITYARAFNKETGEVKELFQDSNDELRKAVERIKQLPPIQPEIIYCGDGCKFWNRHAGEQAGTCYILRQCTSDSFYCGNAKRKEVNHESN